MKVGIITQPLLNNYGGILQNFALQQVLKSMNHEYITIDYISHISFKRYLAYTIKTILYFLSKNRRSFIPYFRKRKPIMQDFVTSHILLTKEVRSYEPKIIDEYNIDAVIVGSDQVWRPQYNNNIKDMYLSFLKRRNVVKIAYAASFGVDKWEYNKNNTIECRQLVKLFNAISVRENSGVSLCRDYLEIDAEEVLDPTLLLCKDEYEKVCSHIPKSNIQYIASYILDLNDEKKAIIDRIVTTKKLVVKLFGADSKVELSIAQWLSMFRDADFVVTDSFHGMLFSVIFNKQFVVIANKARGISRFTSFLSKFDLLDKLVYMTDDLDFVTNITYAEIDYGKVNSLRREEILKSKTFLEKAFVKV